MINKFQQGGILQQIQQLPKEQQQQLMQAFSQWAKQKGVDINQLQQDPNALEQALGQFMQELQAQQTQAARHGAKLNYLKTLKNKCAEDEEPYYYKKGGSVGCGCKKKFQEGGTTPKKDTGVTKFRQDQKKKKENNTWTSQDDKHLLNARRKNGKNLTPEEKTAIQKWNNLSQEQKSKHQLEEGKSGMKVEKDCGGSTIAKFKMHRQGGSLNKISFMQHETPKGGLVK